jgi:hypothetical protein
MLLKYCSQLLPPVMILPLQLHSECKKNTPTTAEIWPGQGRKQQEFPAAVVNKSPELFSSCKILLKCSQLLPPVLNLQLQIHSKCQKKTPTTAELQGQGNKHNTLPAACFLPVLNLQLQIHSECQKKKKTPTIAELQGQGKKKTQYTPSYFPQFIKKYLKAKEEL